jgi:oligo-1,6-glucosidase
VDLAPEHEFIYAYKKTLDASTSLVVLNFSDEEASFSVPIDFELPEAKVVLSNYPEQDRIGDHSNNITLSGWEGRVYLA